MKNIKINPYNSGYFPGEMIKNHHLLFHLALRDFRVRYARGYCGQIYTVLEPLAMMLIMMFVFICLRNRVHLEYSYFVFGHNYE